MIKRARPIKITINGDFWDCYIYRNRLFVVSMDKTMNVINWEKTVNNLFKTKNYGAECAFLHSDYLYSIKDDKLFDDQDFKQLAIEKINKLNDEALNIDFSSLFLDSNSMKFDQLTIDFEIYNNGLYFSDSSGFYFADINFDRKNPINKNNICQLWDRPVQSINISSSGRIALSTLSDGLYEYNEREFFYDGAVSVEQFPSIYLISKDHSTTANWVFSSLINYSYIDSSKLFPFHWKKEKNSSYTLIRDEELILEDKNDNIKEDTIYAAGNEKVYQISKNGIKGFVFRQNLDEQSEKNHFKIIDDLESINNWPMSDDDIFIQSRVTDFGIIIETTNSLYVIESDRTIHKYGNLNDKIVKWRVYPRSNCYSNQLHIVYDDRIEIISFNNDCFLDQNNKSIGQIHRKYEKE